MPSGSGLERIQAMGSHVSTGSVMKNNGNSLQHTTDIQRADKEMFIPAVMSSGLELRFARGGLKQDVACLKCAGFLDVDENKPYDRPEKAILSLDCSLAETSTMYAAAFALAMKQDVFLGQFKAYQPDLWCEPDHRLTSRSQMEKCKATCGFVLQIEKMQGFGDRQKLETNIAKEIGLQVFHVQARNQNFSFLLNKDIVSVSKAVMEWYCSGCATDCVQHTDLSTDSH